MVEVPGMSIGVCCYKDKSVEIGKLATRSESLMLEFKVYGWGRCGGCSTLVQEASYCGEEGGSEHPAQHLRGF